MINNGIFSISLDFELHWGCFESMQLNSANEEQYFFNTRKVIPSMIDLFVANEIQVTWATVGMLFHQSQMEWQQQQPHPLPTFNNPAVSAYEWIKANGFKGEKDPFHFAPELVNAIIAAPGQELGTHTYAHYYCLEEGQQPDQFRADLAKAIALAKARGVDIRSLVFPRNQFNENYLSVCAELGISSVRSSPDIWYWSPATRSSLLKKAFRTGDAYLPFSPIRPVKVSTLFQQSTALPLQLPASRLYRAWKPGKPFLNQLKLKRILHEMTDAAKHQYYYHLWWHPHNFGNHPQECMKELVIILAHFHRLKQQYGWLSLNMESTTELILEHSHANA